MFGWALRAECVDGALFQPITDPKNSRWKILEKEVVDEVIFRTQHNRNRLMLELMARGGMRVGEVLNLKAKEFKKACSNVCIAIGDTD